MTKISQAAKAKAEELIPRKLRWVDVTSMNNAMDECREALARVLQEHSDVAVEINTLAGEIPLDDETSPIACKIAELSIKLQLPDDPVEAVAKDIWDAMADIYHDKAVAKLRAALERHGLTITAKE